MDNLKSYLVTRLAAVMGAVALFEIIVLGAVRYFCLLRRLQRRWNPLRTA